MKPSDPPGSPAVRVSTDGLRRVYARRSRTVLAALVLFMASVIAAGLGSEIAATNPSGARAIGVGLFALGLTIAYRLVRMAVVVSPGLVTVRGLWGNRSVPAGDVIRFDPPPPYGAFRQSGVRVRLTNGRTLTAVVYQVGQLDGPSVGVAECAELNCWLHSQKGSVDDPTLPDGRRLAGAARVAWFVWLGVLGLLLLLCGALVVDLLVTADDVARAFARSGGY
jgi:hypothetical protein